MPKLIFSIITAADINNDALISYGLSAITELLYASKGRNNSGLTQSIEKIAQIDDFLEHIAHIPQLFADPQSDCYSVYASIIRMLADVPKAQDSIRQSLLSR